MTKLRQKAYEILRKSEKFFKTDMVYLAHGSFWLVSGQLLNTLLSLILSLVFANFVTQEAYGSYRYILATGAFLASFSLTGLNNSTVVAVAKGFEGTFKKAFFLSLKANAAAFVATFIASIYYYVNENTTLSSSILIAGLSLPTIKSFSLYGSYLTGKKLFSKKSIYGLIASGGSTITLITTILLITRENIVLLILSYFTVSLAINAFFFFKIFKIAPEKPIDSKAIKHGFHTSFMNLLGTFANNIDSIIVFQFMGAAELAIYSFAILVPENIKDFIKNIPALAVPKIAMRSIEETKKSVFRKSKMIVLWTAPIVLAYIALTPYIYKILFPVYTASTPFSQAFALTILLAGGLSSATLQAHHATKAIYILTGISHVSRIILMIGLFPLYGIWGIVIGRIISKYLTSFASYVLVKKL